MKELIPYTLAQTNSSKILVEIDAAASEEMQRAGLLDKLNDDASRSFSQALEVARQAVEEAAARLSELNFAANEIEFSFGIKLAAAGNVIITSGSAEANFSIKLKWSPGHKA